MKDKKKSLFMEKNRIYRMFSMAMVEDGSINESERKTMRAILVRRYLEDDIKGRMEEYCDEYHDIKVKDEVSYTLKSLYSLEYTYKEETHQINITNSAYKWLVTQQIEALIKTSNKVDYDELRPILKHPDVFCDIINDIIEEKNEPNVDDYDEDSKKVIGTAFELLKKTYLVVLKKYVEDFTKACVCSDIILHKCEDEFQNIEAAARSQFAGIDQIKQDDKLQELVDLYAIVYSDKVIMDCEREAFRIMCKLFKFQHSSLILQEVVDLYTEHGEKAMMVDPKKWFSRISEKNEYDVNNYTYIKEAIIKYDIQGPLKNGVYPTFTRDIMQRKEKTRKFDRKCSNIAITIFAITALILYAFVSDLLHNPLGPSQNKDTETIEAHQESNINSLIFEYDNLSLKNFFIPNGIRSVIINYGLLLVFLVCFYKVDILKWYENFKYRKLKHETLNYPLHPNGKMWLRVILGVSLMLLIYLTFSVESEIWLKTLFIPMVLLLMMLSIEWLIFMKSEIKDTDSEDDKTKSKQTDNTPLYVLTFVAILLDMGLEAVEWLLDNEINDNYKILLAKLSSAIVLGAICYFSGKFLEMHRAQQKQDRETMDKCVEEIKNGKES